MHTYTHTYTCKYTHIHIHTHTYIHMYINTYIHAYTHTYTCTYTCVYLTFLFVAVILICLFLNFKNNFIKNLNIVLSCLIAFFINLVLKKTHSAATLYCISAGDIYQLFLYIQKYFKHYFYYQLLIDMRLEITRQSPLDQSMWSMMHLT